MLLGCYIPHWYFACIIYELYKIQINVYPTTKFSMQEFSQNNISQKAKNLENCGLVMLHGILELVNIGSGNGLLPDSNKPLPVPLMTNHQWSLVAFICISDHAFGSCYLLQTFAMPPQPQMQFAFTAQYAGLSVCQLVQQPRVNYFRSLHWLDWSRHLITILILLILYHQWGLNPRTTWNFFSFKMWFYFLKLYAIIVIFLFETSRIQWWFNHCGYWWPGALATGHP